MKAIACGFEEGEPEGGEATVGSTLTNAGLGLAGSAGAGVVATGSMTAAGMGGEKQFKQSASGCY